LPIAGKAMIVHVCERAIETGADEVVVAVDDPRIALALDGLPVTRMITSSEHTCGTERLVEVADRLGWADEQPVVNLQGDEPLFRPELARTLASVLVDQSGAEVATLAAPIREVSDIFNPNIVKVVLDRDGYALYFSRAPVPWHRESFADEQRPQHCDLGHLRHIGLYGYTAGFLRRYAGWRRSPLEDIECLEQLRILWHGEKIAVFCIEEAPEAGVDTPADLRRVEQVLARSAKGHSKVDP
jgi:3-deoxy-manno-octulosonate cytidylyltransferase (CMP-KDO synthetase)